MPEYFLSDTDLPPYMAFPRFLMEMDLNDTARIVYMLLLDRCRISQKNVEWCDETGAGTWDGQTAFMSCFLRKEFFP